MKVVILAGGLGTRISEETHLIPKPMIEIGDKPMILHIMSLYAKYGFTEFIICGGYKVDVIKKYFADFALLNGDVEIDLKSNTVYNRNPLNIDWKITVCDTGLETMTGGRLKRIEHLLSDDEPFFMTYGDGLCDVNIQETLVKFQDSSCEALVTAVQPPGRFGALNLGKNGQVDGFVEKPLGDSSWINGGFFVLNKSVISYINGDDCVWETGPLAMLATSKTLIAHCHTGFWQPMDTLREKNYLAKLYNDREAPWT